jgi:hypothetical protein
MSSCIDVLLSWWGEVLMNWGVGGLVGLWVDELMLMRRCALMLGGELMSH